MSAEPLVMIGFLFFIFGYAIGCSKNAPLIYVDAVYDTEDIVKALRLACKKIYTAYNNYEPTEKDIEYKQRMLLREAKSETRK